MSVQAAPQVHKWMIGVSALLCKCSCQNEISNEKPTLRRIERERDRERVGYGE